MPWPKRQWQAIAADYIRRYGETEGRKKLRALKARHGGQVLREASRSRDGKRKP